MDGFTFWYLLMLQDSFIPSAEKWAQCVETRGRRKADCTWFQYLYIWDSFNVGFCSDEKGKGFLECLVGSDPNPWNPNLSEMKVFQENQRKLSPRAHWCALMQMQTPMKRNLCFLGPSLSSSLFFIVVILPGLYWGSLYMYLSNVQARGRGNSF